jgi:hypothetical protein
MPGFRAAWGAADEVYGGNPHLRSALECRQVGYLLAVACDHQIATRAGKVRADALARKLPKRAWQKLSAGAGAKGHAPLLRLGPGHQPRPLQGLGLGLVICQVQRVELRPR